MTEEAAPALAACLAQQPHLTALNLNDTCLTDGGVAAVCKALVSTAPKLQVGPCRRGARGLQTGRTTKGAASPVGTALLRGLLAPHHIADWPALPASPPPRHHVPSPLPGAGTRSQRNHA
jgi:hypothetical protein